MYSNDWRKEDRRFKVMVNTKVANQLDAQQRLTELADPIHLVDITNGNATTVVVDDTPGAHYQYMLDAGLISTPRFGEFPVAPLTVEEELDEQFKETSFRVLLGAMWRKLKRVLVSLFSTGMQHEH